MNFIDGFFFQISVFFYFTSGDVNVRQKSRKRTRNPSGWKAAIQKQLVQSGKEHVSKFGNKIDAKIFEVQIVCMCRFKCHEKINESAQKSAFDHYYSFRNWTEKKLFLKALMKEDAIKENVNLIVPRYKLACKYFLHDSDGKEQQVCQRFLSNCLRISCSTLARTIKRYFGARGNVKERRGKIATKKYSEKDLNLLRDFIRSFPTYDSHYKISPSNKQYLSPFLNIRRMFSEYKIKCEF